VWRLLLTAALLCGWGAAPVAATPQTTAELAALILTPEELGAGFATVLDEPDERGPSYFRVMDRQSPSVAAIGITLISDPVATPREAVAVLVRPFLVGYTPGMPFAPPDFPDGAFAIPLTGGESGQPTSGIVLGWQEGGILAVMTVLVEWGPDATDADVAAEIERWIGLQRDKLAGGPGQQPVAAGRVAPAAQVPAQMPVKPVDR
jgi:hypothetical protein